MEAGKVTHVETETRRMWRYQDLPEEAAGVPERFQSEMGYAGHQFMAGKCYEFFGRWLKGAGDAPPKRLAGTD